MNHLICSADRTTHMKIVVAAMMASIGILTFAVSVRINTDNGHARTSYIIKAEAHVHNKKFAAALPRSELRGDGSAWGNSGTSSAP